MPQHAVLVLKLNQWHCSGQHSILAVPTHAHVSEPSASAAEAASLRPYAKTRTRAECERDAAASGKQEGRHMLLAHRRVEGGGAGGGGGGVVGLPCVGIYVYIYIYIYTHTYTYVGAEHIIT